MGIITAQQHARDMYSLPTTLKEVVWFVRELERNNHMFHFDDDPYDCLEKVATRQVIDQIYCCMRQAASICDNKGIDLHELGLMAMLEAEVSTELRRIHRAILEGNVVKINYHAEFMLQAAERASYTSHQCRELFS